MQRFDNAGKIDGLGDTMKLLLTVVGMVMIVEGLPYFAFPERIKVWLVRISEMEAAHLRAFGFTAMCVGMILVYFGQRSSLF
jgi:uncharacterized protein YjeT (DUF2065 family)